MLIKVQTTPNPDAIKFIVDKKWIEFVWECTNAKEANKSSLAKKLWDIEGVSYLMFATDFVSVVKDSNAIWEVMQPDIIDVISDFLLEDKGIFSDVILDFAQDGSEKDASENEGPAQEKLAYNDREYTDFEKKIILAIEEKVQPALAHHGGWVKFIEFVDEVLLIEMRGACKGCPSSLATLKSGIENLMKYYFPEIKEVQEISLKNAEKETKEESEKKNGI